MIKNDNESRGEIHPTALAVLAQYQTIAIDWPRYPSGRAVRCGKCDQALYFTTDITGKPYIFEDHEKLALTVAHIRQNHSEVINGNE
jgi:hypothetical protein